MSAPGTAAPVSADELQRLVDRLQDDKSRRQLVDELKALIAAQRGAEAKPAEPPDLFARVSAKVDTMTGEILAGAAVVVDSPRLVAWGSHQVSDPVARERLIQIVLALGTVFGLALVAEWAVRRIWLRLLPRRPAQRRDLRLIRAVFALLQVIVDTLPILAFAVTAMIVAPITLAPFSSAQITLTLLVEAIVAARLILGFARSLLLPDDSNADLVPASEENRTYLFIWAKRLVCCTAFGWAVTQSAWWLGVPGGVYELMQKTVGLVLAILGIVFVLQNRVVIGDWIAGPPAETANGRSASWHRLRRRLGESWHVLAIVYIAGIYIVDALQIEGGFVYILRATVLSLIVLTVARFIVRFIERTSARGFAIAPDLRARFPGLEQRANRYLPILTGLFSIIVYGAALLALLQAWDVRSFEWLGSDLGRRATATGLSIAGVLAVAVIGWEILAAGIERHLNSMEAAGAPSRARRRTLLPLLRTAMLCVIVVMAALTILSQLGINIAPLLAGAGVIGLAIGFGSQALVKDVITGLFILIEDQIAVGDIVDVGKDHKGLVEAISIRTIRLRDQAGIVHTLPFSEVTTVKNMSKDFAYAVSRIAIAYAEDVDRVVEILRGASDELMRNETMAPLIIDPFDYQGVDSLDEFSLALLVRIRTIPGKHIVVGRAFNRLVKLAFDREGVVTRDPSPIVVSGSGAAALRDVASDADAAKAIPLGAETLDQRMVPDDRLRTAGGR